MIQKLGKHVDAHMHLPSPQTLYPSFYLAATLEIPFLYYDYGSIRNHPHPILLTIQRLAGAIHYGLLHCHPAAHVNANSQVLPSIHSLQCMTISCD